MCRSKLFLFCSDCSHYRHAHTHWRPIALSRPLSWTVFRDDETLGNSQLNQSIQRPHCPITESEQPHKQTCTSSPICRIFQTACDGWTLFFIVWFKFYYYQIFFLRRRLALQMVYRVNLCRTFASFWAHSWKSLAKQLSFCSRFAT